MPGLNLGIASSIESLIVLLRRDLSVDGSTPDELGIWRRMGRNFTISLGGSTALVAIGLVRTALLSKSITVDDYGRVLIVFNLFQLLTTFAGVRVGDVLYRFFRQFEEENADALQALVWLCLGICLGVGLLVGGGVFVSSEWIARRFYGFPGLAPLFRVYASAVLVSVFGGFSRAVLQINNRYAGVVLPQVAAGSITILTLGAYLAAVDRYRLEWITAAFAAGVMIQSIPPLVKSIQLLRPYLSMRHSRPKLRSLHQHRHDLVGVLFNTNLTGYLKLAYSPGDLFLLGVFSTPSQVALYGLARQLGAPMSILMNNLQSAVTPEITTLGGRRQWSRMKRFTWRYVVIVSALGGGAVLGLMLFARPLVLALSRPEYLDALPVFRLLLLCGWINLILTVVYPAGLSLDALKWHNLALLLSWVPLVAVGVSMGFSAMLMAVIQLASWAIYLVVYGSVVYSLLRRKHNESL
jgi:O-antigen/teichoic acid export membrane protein